MSRATDSVLTYCARCEKYKMGRHFYAITPGAGPGGDFGTPDKGGFGRGICKQCWSGNFGGTSLHALPLGREAGRQFVADLVNLREEIDRVCGCR